MVVRSAGLLLYRLEPSPQVLIAHMGGPFWAKKDAGAWSIPKGEYDPAPRTPWVPLTASSARSSASSRPRRQWAELGTFAYSSGKKIVVFCGDGAGFMASAFTFGTFEMEWPPRSGRTASFPEVDRAEWMDLDAAREALVKGQRPVIDALERALPSA